MSAVEQEAPSGAVVTPLRPPAQPARPGRRHWAILTSFLACVVAPVLAGDTVAVTITIKALRETAKGNRGIATLEFDVSNQRGETVQTGVNRLMIYA